MAIIAPTVAKPALARLDWESKHFGVSAAQLVSPRLTDDALVAVLRDARKDRVQFVVWPADSGREVPRVVLDQFGGILVDRKATYRKLLHGEAAEVASPRPADPSVTEYPSNTASAALVDLAIVAGAYSRFRVDPRIPEERFEAMYRQWIERSVKKELADVVFIVPADDMGADRHERPCGMISLSETDGVASIGLVAVAGTMQGRGIGSALMRAAHRWMRDRNAHEARVVTQSANIPACRLYERSGYQLARTQPYYHFWL